MPANSPTFRRPEPWDPNRKPDADTGPKCYGDLHRASLQIGIPDNNGGHRYAAPHEFVECWEDRKERRARERAGIVAIGPVKRQQVGGRRMKVTPAVRRQVRRDWLKFSLTSIAAHYRLSLDQVARLTRDLGPKPRCSAERPAAARVPAGKLPARRPSGSGSSRRPNERLRRVESRAVSRGSKANG